MHRFASLVVATLTAMACSDAPTGAVFDQTTAEASPAATGRGAAGTFEVAITNLTETQYFTPPLVATHRQALEVFEVGRAASFGVKEIAENGNLAPLNGTLTGHRHVADVVIAVGDPPPLVPGETRAFEITAEHGAMWLSWVSMLICTNDGFTGLDSFRLPRDVGESIAWHTAAYDAGTEINTEDADDLVPPCGELSGIHDGSVGTGTSDPALAENGVIHHHPGTQGGADLTPGLHGWSNPVARVVVTRVN